MGVDFDLSHQQGEGVDIRLTKNEMTLKFSDGNQIGHKHDGKNFNGYLAPTCLQACDGAADVVQW